MFGFYLLFHLRNLCSQLAYCRLQHRYLIACILTNQLVDYLGVDAIDVLEKHARPHIIHCLSEFGSLPLDYSPDSGHHDRNLLLKTGFHGHRQFALHSFERLDVQRDYF